MSSSATEIQIALTALVENVSECIDVKNENAEIMMAKLASKIQNYDERLAQLESEMDMLQAPPEARPCLGSSSKFFEVSNVTRCENLFVTHKLFEYDDITGVSPISANQFSARKPAVSGHDIACRLRTLQGAGRGHSRFA